VFLDWCYLKDNTPVSDGKQFHLSKYRVFIQECWDVERQ